VESSRGKSAVKVRIQWLGPGHDWTGFRYGVRCRTGGQGEENGAGGVGGPASGAAHPYCVSTPTWLRPADLCFSVGGPARAPRPRLRASDSAIRIAWDDESAPAVDAPLDLFFGGTSGREPVASLALGYAGGIGTCAFPMPFRQQARLQLFSKYGAPVRGVEI